MTKIDVKPIKIGRGSIFGVKKHEILILEFCTEKSQIKPKPLLVGPSAKFWALRGTNYYFCHFMATIWVFCSIFLEAWVKLAF